MNRPRWKDKWRALSDMKAARNVAQETTSKSMTTAQNGASDATITKAEMYRSGNPNSQLNQKIRQMEDKFWMDLVQNYPIQDFVWSTLQDSVYVSPRRGQTMHVGNPPPEPSASSITTSKENSAVCRNVPSQVIQKPPSILQGEAPTKSLT